MLGAALLPRMGTNGGAHAKGWVQDGETRTISRNFMTSIRNPGEPSVANNMLISQRLVSIPNCAGGVVPVVNTTIGAPMCTFAEGGIGADEQSPYYDLVKGPAASDIMYDTKAYAPSFDGEATVSAAVGGDFDEIEVEASGILGMPCPTMPRAYMDVFNELAQTSRPTLQKTYNIWRRVSPAAIEGVKLIKNQGPVGDAYTQLPGDGDMCLEVQGNCTLKRLFPMSRDMLYENATVVYPADRLFKVSSRPVRMRGGANCGFQLHFWHGRPRTNVITQNNDTFDGTIVIEWGDEDAADSEDLLTVSRFRLTLTVNQEPRLEYLHPRTRKFEFFSIAGPVFAPEQQESSYSIYVHYAGPVMLLGFEPNPLTWNCFNPPLSDEKSDDENSIFPPYVSENATIQVTFRYISAKFKYGPIAFNNYHPENLQVDGLDDDTEDLGFVRANFTAPVAKADSIEPTALNEYFVSHRLLDSLSQDEVEALESAPTFYGDWRRDTAYGAELMYTGELTRPAEPAAGETEQPATCSGRVMFNTTCEGPLFFHVRPPTGAPMPPDPLVKQFSKWGDLTSYLHSWSVDYTLENSNASRLSGSARVTLKNLAATQFGRKVLAFLEENMPTITLGGGFGSPETFFQGFVVSQQTTRGADGTSTTVLECRDILSVMLEYLVFPQTYYFDGVRYNDIIRTCIEVVGLDDWYQEQLEIYQGTGDEEEDAVQFANFRRAVEIRLATRISHAALSTPVINADPTMNIGQVVDAILDLMLAFNVIPVFYWDHTDGVIRLSWRYDPSFADGLQFVGAPNEENVTFLPNNSAEFQHGVLTGDYQERTYNDFLYSDFFIMGFTQYGEPYAALEPEDRNSDAYSQATIDAINRSFLDNEPLPENLGYIGFPKWYVETQKQMVLLTKDAIRRRARSVYDVRRKTYQTISFQCHVTKPLHHMGRFYLQTFVGQGTALNTDMYFYKGVSYSFDKEQNMMTAAIEGETFPAITKNVLPGRGSVEGGA